MAFWQEQWPELGTLGGMSIGNPEGKWFIDSLTFTGLTDVTNTAQFLFEALQQGLKWLKNWPSWMLYTEQAWMKKELRKYCTTKAELLSTVRTDVGKKIFKYVEQKRA